MSIGAETIFSVFNAKPHLSQLLRDVEGGNTVIITRRGTAVAKLVPIENNPANFKEALKRLEQFSDKIQGKVNIKELRDENRRY